MMSAQQMNRMADEAAERAARKNRNPVKFPGPKKIPFLGNFVTHGFKRVDCEPIPNRYMGCTEGYLFVDSSGCGNSHEPALTLDEFTAYAKAHPQYYFAIVEAGRFQVVIATYEKL